MQTTNQTIHSLQIKRESIYANHKRLAQPLKSSQKPIEQVNLINHFRLFDKFIQTQTKDAVIHNQCLALYKRYITALDNPKKGTLSVMRFYQLQISEFSQHLINGTLSQLLGQSTSCFRALPKER